ncbi:uncharacterized protein LOC129776461 [Toxorhynchites rutilus septentrionalis]|uniref:uncharacterized protein LOC129776461 n=1 Tax=Toxorhynchites rutilus septentrionalis TaxID=329112 RepID=UPI00247896CA|nr:uncharacterized protein LOC129776461 [Toxorhynchites rutilus septentrionalis]
MSEKASPTLIEESCDVPEWLNAKYFEEVLRKAKNDSTIKVRSINVRYALPKGENYASTIYRVLVEFHTKDQFAVCRSYIVKGMATSSMAEQKLGEYDVHAKEMDVYQLVIPEMKRLMRSIGDRSELYPKTLAIDRNNDVIIFSDLSLKGYIMADRTTGIDVTHTKMSLDLMAKLHASSLRLAEMYPTILNRFKTGMMTRETDAFYPMFYSNLDALTEEISTWDPKWNYYASKLRKLRPHFVEQGLQVFDHEKDDDLRVFVHGDLWTNNLLFKYDATGRPLDAVLLDFQFCCYGTPMIDLCYFFFTSTQDDIRQNCFEELMQYYYYRMTDYAKKLKCNKKLPTLHQFQQQLLRKLFYAVYSSFIALPIQMNEQTADADFEALMGDDERARRFKKTIMANRKYHKIIKGLLPTFDKKGLLDKLD